MVGYPSGQRGQTVNLLAYAFSGSNPEPTTILFHKGNSGFSQINSWFYRIPCFETLRFSAFTVSCVPVLFDADKATIKQPMRQSQSAHQANTKHTRKAYQAQPSARQRALWRILAKISDVPNQGASCACDHSDTPPLSAPTSRRLASWADNPKARPNSPPSPRTPKRAAGRRAGRAKLGKESLFCWSDPPSRVARGGGFCVTCRFVGVPFQKGLFKSAPHLLP
jgi:hypothetical protein